ncbi:MAG: Phosphorylated carbohydrates phosphatase [Anaerolineales bacterium]|nr:Phosphorylated carbohydrates phosphatase [Anaerolineales bacterium]
MLKALIFDFDGLILDTETPEVDVWQAIYREHGHELPVDEWAKTIGGYGLSTFDAATHLSALTGRDAARLRARYRLESDALIHAKTTQPGVVDLIHNGKQRALKLAVASSSPHAWVDAHLARLGLAHHFDAVVCSEDVGPGRTKPNPDIFLEALNQLRVTKEAAVIFEDSPNGVKAARAAGVFVVAVPNPLTARLGVHGANLTVNSLAEVTIASLNAMLNSR